MLLITCMWQTSSHTFILSGYYVSDLFNRTTGQDIHRYLQMHTRWYFSCKAYVIIQSFLYFAPLVMQSAYHKEDTGGVQLKAPHTPYGNLCMINTACVYTVHSLCNQSTMTHTALGKWDNIHIISEECVGAIFCFVVLNGARSPVILIK